MPAKSKSHLPFVHHKAALMYGISRIDQTDNCTHGYYLRLRAANVSWFYSDGKNGGKKQCLETCQRDRDKQVMGMSEADQLRASKVRKRAKKKTTNKK